MQNHLEALPTISMPEDGLNILGPASSLVQGWSSHDYRHRVGTQARALGEAVADIDTESSGTQNRDAFLAVAENAAASLILASEQLGGEEFVVEQGNAALGDLIALNEWENRLGPRFEL